MAKETITSSAPGRLCLLGEHQDYFGLPILAAAINLRITISGKPIPEKEIRLDLPDIGEKKTFSLGQTLTYAQERDYLRSAVNILQRQGLFFSSGWDCRVQGSIPINSGTASSSALVVAWIRFLLEAAEGTAPADPQRNAELAFQAEVAEFNEPGGKMDHYASAYGGVISLHFNEQIQVHAYPNQLGDFVLADSLIRKNTTGTLGFIKSHVLTGVERIRQILPIFSLNSVVGEQEREEIGKLPPVEKRLLEGTLETRELTAEGETLFKAGEFDHIRFGELLNRQQDVVRDHLQISVPKIDRMIETSLAAGALGAKINGSGQGGCIFAYTPGKAEAVVDALNNLDTRPMIIRIGSGASSEQERS